MLHKYGYNKHMALPPIIWVSSFYFSVVTSFLVLMVVCVRYCVNCFFSVPFIIVSYFLLPCVIIIIFSTHYTFICNFIFSSRSEKSPYFYGFFSYFSLFFNFRSFNKFYLIFVLEDTILFFPYARPYRYYCLGGVKITDI